MKEYSSNSLNDELDLKDLFQAFWIRKNLIILITFTSAIFSVFFALSLPNIYTSSALLAPTSPNESLESKIGVSSIAGITGLNLPQNYVKKSTEAIERIKSYDFFVEEFLPNIMYENLVAVRRWDRNTNKILYDENLFDQNTNKWNEHNGKSLKPSSQTAYKVYRQIFYIAEKWMNLIIKSINDYMRDLDKKVAQNSIDYLNKTFLETSLTEIKDVVSRLIETQIQTLTLAEANKDYIFKPLASPIAPERKSKPSRATTCITITMLGFVFSLLLSAFLHYKNISMASNPKKT